MTDSRGRTPVGSATGQDPSASGGTGWNPAPEAAAGFLRALMVKSPEYLLIVDRERRIVDVNRVNLFGREEVVGRRLDEFAGDEQLEPMQRAVADAFERGEYGVYDGYLDPPDGGKRRQYRNHLIPLSTELLLLRAVDITEDIERQHALEASEERYRSLTAHLPDFVVMIDRERRFLWANRVAEGFTMDQVLGARVDDFTAPDAAPGTVAAIEEAFRTGEPTRYVARTDAVGDSPRWYLTRAVPMPAGGKLDRILLLTADITEQKRAELALSASEERLEQALHAADIGLWEWIPSRNVVLASGLWARAAGHPAATDEVTLETFYGSVHPEDRTRAQRTIEGAASDDVTGFELEYRVRADADDPGRWLLHRGRFMAPGDPSLPPRVVGTQLDVTARRDAERERMSLQEQLQRAQRLESIGQLAGGVAHDFNNLLLVVLSQTELARRAAQRGDDPSGPLAQVQAASERAAELTKKLLAFSRQQGLSTRTVALGELVHGLLTMLRRLIPENITLDYVATGNGDHATVDAGQLEQVLLNLCLNARDAMPDGGRIQIETGSRELDAEDPREHPALAPGPYASVRVRDTGNGIPPEVQRRMFEPFFTTKPAGQGTGLGLSVSEGIIKQHGGFIRVDSTPGRGTTFEILLPQSDDYAIAAPPRPRNPRPQPGTETVLVAEDEDMVRSLVAQILSDAGYSVIEARDGLQAVNAFERHASDISLVLLDAIMPNLSGREAYERIAALDPAARFLISSGYSDEQMPEALLKRENLAMLQKPYAPDDLLRAVRTALDAPR